jgi:uncharacterized repeat protein (TIGR01451 family)
MKKYHFLTAAAAVTMSASAFSETAFNIPISNTATLTYTVNSADQISVSDEEIFNVDRKITFNITHPSAMAGKAIVDSEQAVEYTITNTSNSPLRFELSVTDLAENETAYTAGDLATDNTATSLITSYNLFQESNGTSGYQTDDTAIVGPNPFIELDANDDAPNGDDQTVIYVVAKPSQGIDDDIFVFTLTADVKEHSNVALFDNSLTPGQTQTDNTDDVWVKGTTQTIVGPNGLTNSVNDAVQVSSADLTVLKEAIIISDPISTAIGGTSEKKAIPGAVIQYTITVTNNGSEEANAVVIGDGIPAQFDLTAAAKTDTVSSSKLQDNSDTDIVGSQGAFTGNTLAFPAQTIAAGEKLTAIFEVVIQ